MEGMEEMDRCERLDVLWRLWQRNYGVDTTRSCESILHLVQNTCGGFEHSNEQQSIKSKSLGLIMEQLFAEIKFLKEEIRFLRDEGTHKSDLITTLTDNTLHKMNRKGRLNEFKHTDNQFLSNGTKFDINAHNNINEEDDSQERRINDKSEASSSNSTQDALSLLHDDTFLKEEIEYLREETKEKSKLIETLTEALTRNNLKEEIHLDKLAKQCNDLTKKRQYDKTTVKPTLEDDGLPCHQTEDSIQVKKEDLAHEIIEECGLNYLMDYELGEII